MGAKTLARAIARDHGGSVEDRRRTVVRWLQGATPVVRNRHLVEDVLGLERDSLKADDEDEEDSLLRDVSLEDVLRLHIRRLLQDELVRKAGLSERGVARQNLSSTPNRRGIAEIRERLA